MTMNTESSMGKGLITLSGNLESPRDAKASDFTVGGSQGAAGESSGAGKLLQLTSNQEGPRNTQDSGDNTPSVWGVKGMDPQKSKSESTSVKCDWAVSFDTGQISPPLEDEKY